jgi:dCMP deaminase
MYKWDFRFLQMAKLVSSWSKDPSTQTGAVIVRPNRTVAGVGFNGFPHAMPDVDDNYGNREEKYSRIIHCEINALIFSGGIPAGSTLYTWPFLSCDRCCVQMVQAGIVRFVAPFPTEDQSERWGSAFNKVKRYCIEMGVDVLEYSREDFDVED